MDGVQVIEANFRRLEERNRELELSARDREHTHELLITDKAYLTQQASHITQGTHRGWYTMPSPSWCQLV
jgi:hypothetical protein